MLIAIISDIHNNEVNLEKVLNYCNGNAIKTIICCGDLASQETLDFLSDNFEGDVHYAFGNMDDGQLGHLLSDKNLDSLTYGNIIIYRSYGELEIDHKKIAFVHYPNIAKILCNSKKYAFVFYGHTHKPWEEMIGDCKMLNPGNVAGEIYPPTFAVWDTEGDKFDLVRIHELK